MPREQLLGLPPTSPWRGWQPVYMLSDRFVVTPTAMAVRLEELDWMHRDAEGIPNSGPKVTPGQQSLFP